MLVLVWKDLCSIYQGWSHQSFTEIKTSSVFLWNQQRTVYFLPQNYIALRCWWYFCQIVKRNINTFSFPPLSVGIALSRNGIRQITKKEKSEQRDVGFWHNTLNKHMGKGIFYKSLCSLLPEAFYRPQWTRPYRWCCDPGLWMKWKSLFHMFLWFCRTLGKRVLCGLTFTWGGLQLCFKIFEKQSYFLPKESKAIGKNY